MVANIELKFLSVFLTGSANNRKQNQGEEMLGRSRYRDPMSQTGAFSATSASRIGVRGLAKGSAAVLLASLLVGTPVTATAEGTALDQLRAEDSDASIALDWQRTALRTIFTEAATPVPASALYLGFTSLAVDDAVGRALGQNASASAAAAVAAHDVLVAYFKASTTNLDADLATSLSKIPDGQAERKGIKLGGAAAATMVANRVDDGRNTQVSYNKPAEAGIWQPPASGMAVPWLGFVKPLVLQKPVNVDGPDPIGSAAYAADFNEVKRVGSATSSERTAAQTDTANFFSVNPVLQLRVALLDHLDSHPLSLAQTTRLFAALDAATADALIQTWRLKYDIGFWRPFQAIPRGDLRAHDHPGCRRACARGRSRPGQVGSLGPQHPAVDVRPLPRPDGDPGRPLAAADRARPGAHDGPSTRRLGYRRLAPRQ